MCSVCLLCVCMHAGVHDVCVSYVVCKCVREFMYKSVCMCMYAYVTMYIYVCVCVCVCVDVCVYRVCLGISPLVSQFFSLFVFVWLRVSALRTRLCDSNSVLGDPNPIQICAYYGSDALAIRRSNHEMI